MKIVKHLPGEGVLKGEVPPKSSEINTQLWKHG